MLTYKNKVFSSAALTLVITETVIPRNEELLINSTSSCGK